MFLPRDVSQTVALPLRTDRVGTVSRRPATRDHATYNSREETNTHRHRRPLPVHRRHAPEEVAYSSRRRGVASERHLGRAVDNTTSRDSRVPRVSRRRVDQDPVEEGSTS